MPELPEVQTVVDDLNRKIKNRKITGVWTDARKIVRGSFPDFRKSVIGRKILRVERRAKNILIYFDSGKLMLTHLKMTGHYLVGRWDLRKPKPTPVSDGRLSEKVNAYIHVVFVLDDGRMLALSDLRKFAKIMFGDVDDICANLKDLGPEATEISFKDFDRLLEKSRKPIKKLLMDQNLIAGIGNIYSDEILFDAKIHPLSLAGSLDPERRKRLYRSIKKILKKALELRGTSVSDFRDTSGVEGDYGLRRLVYRREGKPCPGKCPGKVKRIKIGGRSSYYCSDCQKL